MDTILNEIILNEEKIDKNISYLGEIGNIFLIL
jgi:hypothetical protein